MDHVPFDVNVGLNDQIYPDSLTASLENELSCAVLEELYPNLDFFARKSSHNIDPIHKHLQKGRKVVPTEDPNMHLVWTYDAVHVKPLPPHLLSHSFWDRSLAPGSEHRGNALGFVRSYERLVRHPSDFELAKEARLIPPCSGPPRGGKTWPAEPTHADFAAFIRSFSDVGDAEVSPRWHFGQLRLSRLHWAVRIFRPAAAARRGGGGLTSRLFYEEEFWQIRQFLGESAAPLLFVFAALSLILSAMQVVLAAKAGGDDGDGGGGWRAFAEASAWFAVLVIAVVAAVFVGLAAVGLGFWLWQFRFGYRSWRRSRAAVREAKLRDGRGG
ncbi:hypothetical protein LX32DRAFT_644920 [Colletotrichum zoysiae]|uniref:Uncharacterized protein n=1 Tax=Colletotrichum zoysiae TaxID=1216348 RepID=A0AAD9H5Y1_9PEZI|nr:hypothetical protein LX32DRAFT_644920 [Colletotrichum zoysiae]